MKSIFCVVAVLGCFLTSSAQATEKMDLKAMGLNSIQAMSDEAGHAVRGQGFYRVSGFYRAYTPGFSTGSFSVSSTTSGVSNTTSFSSGGFTVVSRSYSR
jgi:hypothetical protein